MIDWEELLLALNERRARSRQPELPSIKAMLSELQAQLQTRKRIGAFLGICDRVVSRKMRSLGLQPSKRPGFQPKFSRAQIVAIKSAFAQRIPHKLIMARYGISRTHLRRIGGSNE